MNPEHMAKLREGQVTFKAWRKANPATQPDLSAADLSWANLSWWDLSRADLSRANLDWATLWRADLTDADLTGAKLTGARLTDADLTDAKLSGAHLLATAFNRTRLVDTDLSGAELGRAMLADLDLRQAKGLTDVIHMAPSSISIDTLVNSKGEIPDVFLQGCGVPSTMIAYMPSLCTPRALEFYSAFISYSHADAELAETIYQHLWDQGISVWKDDHALVPGDDQDWQITDAIRTADRLIFLASEASLSSWWVDRELTRSQEKEQRLWKNGGLPEGLRLVIPIDVDGHLFDEDCPSPWAADLKRPNALRLNGWESDSDLLNESLDQIVTALRPYEHRIPILPPPKLS